MNVKIKTNENELMKNHRKCKIRMNFKLNQNELIKSK